MTLPSASTAARARPPSMRIDGDFGARADLDAGAAAGRGHRRRDRAHAAHHVADESLLRLRAAAEEMKQEPEQRARVIGPAVLAVEAVREDERFQVRRIERAVEELAEAARREGDEVRDLAAAQAPEAQRELQHLAKSREAFLRAGPAAPP